MTIRTEDLRRMRISAGLTQIELADAIGKTQPYIARMERGKLDPPLSVVHEIVEALSGQTTKTCADVMTSNPVTVDPRSSVSQAVQRMSEGPYSQLPVVRMGRIVGIITTHDVIRNLERDLDDINIESIMNPSGIPIFDEDTPIGTIINLFAEYQAVLIQKQGRLTGIITLQDLFKLGPENLVAAIS
ncbi:MAG: CBS domain-containing protein [Candidatus Thorarchaeota archaeon]